MVVPGWKESGEIGGYVDAMLQKGQCVGEVMVVYGCCVAISVVVPIDAGVPGIMDRNIYTLYM